MNNRNWGIYAFEFLSIFVAVISAFALNNWNENRKSRQAESKILVEIYNGLEKDTEDLNLNIYGHEMGLDAIRYFRDLLADKPVATDSLLIHYLNLTRDFVSIQNTSGYETLKSRGLELIQDDSLRRDIISLYEYDFKTLSKLEEEYYELQFQENYFREINALLSGNFELDADKRITGIRTPLNISAEEEKIFASYLWKIETNRRFIKQYYSSIKREVESLQAKIAEKPGI